MRGQIDNLGITKKQIEKNLIEGMGVLSHDMFLSIVTIEKKSEEKFIVTIPHYINNISAINSDEEFEKAVKLSPKREVTLVLKNNKIEYSNGKLCSEIPFVSSCEEVQKFLERLKYINYKDTGFVTVLIDEDCNYLQAPCILAGSFG